MKYPFRTLGATVVLLAVAWLASHAQQAFRLESEPDWSSPARARYVLTDREAILPLPSQLVAEPTILRALWSPDGRHVLALRQEMRLAALDGRPPEGETSLILWNRRARRAAVIWKRPLGTTGVQEIAWLPGAGMALAIVGSFLAPDPEKPGELEPRRELLRIDAARGTARALALLGMDERLFPSPTHPIAALLRRETKEERKVVTDGHEAIYYRQEVSLRFARAGGMVGPPIRMPEDVHDVSWLPDGRPVIVQPDRESKPTPGQPHPLRWHTVDPASGTIHPLSTLPTLAAASPPELPVRLTQSTVPLGKETPPERVRPLWLESAAPGTPSRALLCGDSDGGMLSPDGDSVLYIAQGAAWVTPLLRVPKQAFLDARRAALKAVTLSNGKQIGLALAMYAQDYDEVFPPSDANTVDRLRPYTKSQEVFNDPSTGAPGFLYLLQETPLKTIDNPAETPIGYLTGPGVRAVIYVDGHVKWEDQQPGKR